MNRFRTGLLFGAMAGIVTAATVFAQFGTPPATGGMHPPQTMGNQERREALERCDAHPAGPSKDRCMNDLQVNRNAASAPRAPASRMGDGRTGAPGIGVGASAVKPAVDPVAAGDRSGAAQGARSGP